MSGPPLTWEERIEARIRELDTWLKCIVCFWIGLVVGYAFGWWISSSGG